MTSDVLLALKTRLEEAGGLSPDALQFLAGYFAMGPRSEIISHEPHTTLTKQLAAYEECLDAGLVQWERYNDHGSIRITATAKGHHLAQEAFRALIAQEQP
ncbi:hypothetical protein [Microvirga arsenatis]|uniref:ArsR family transcriptional regulator n=1 Tax=Microvirga arsenatis TaxID=2692265 RepID=A0ABW9Z078_9HYPH|nr:hypothetical protein [Microvirga arsenatis]NBJ13242.1 hypothetical protein [Microvirga arsenatis]NBJ25120.1 hypothetical protein [Microvirga arsenatis]